MPSSQVGSGRRCVNRSERDTLVADMRALLQENTDRFLLLRLDPRSRLYSLGKAVPAADPDYFYIG